MTQIKRTFIVVGLAAMILSFQNCSKGFQAPAVDPLSALANPNGMKQVGAKLSSVSHSFSGNQNFTQTLPAGASWIAIDWNCSSSSQSVSLGAEILDANNVVILNEPLCSLASTVSSLETIAGTTLMPIPALGKKVHFLSGFASSGNNFPTVTATFYKADTMNLATPGPAVGNLSYDSAAALTPDLDVPVGAAWLFAQSTCDGQTMKLTFKNVSSVALMDYTLCYPGATTVGNGSVMIPLPVGAVTASVTNTIAGVSVGASPTSVILASSTFYGAGYYAVTIPSARAASFTYSFPTAGSDSLDLSIPSGSTWVDAWAACQNDSADGSHSLTATFKDNMGNAMMSFEACNFATVSSFDPGYAPFQIPIPLGAAKIKFQTGDTVGTSIKVILSGYFWR